MDGFENGTLEQQKKLCYAELIKSQYPRSYSSNNAIIFKEI
jgi:hypothetical protein